MSWELENYLSKSAELEPDKSPYRIIDLVLEKLNEANELLGSVCFYHDEFKEGQEKLQALIEELEYDV